MDETKRGVQSIEVGGRLLAVMASADEALMLRDIAAGAAVTPAQAHAYLVSFRKIGLVQQASASGRYSLGPFALQLGLARLRSIDALRLAGDSIVELASELGVMVTLTVWGSFGATVVQAQEGAGQVHVSVRAGTVYSVRGTATGRVFAAFLPPAMVAEHLESEINDGTIAQRVGYAAADDRFAKNVARIRREGFATAVGSPIPGVNAVCAPIFNHTGQIQLAVTLIGPTKAVDVGPNSRQVRRLLSFTEAVSAELGHDGSMRSPDPERVPAPAPAVTHPGKLAPRRPERRA